MHRVALVVVIGCASLIAMALPGLGTASAVPVATVTITGATPAVVTGPATATLNYTITVTGIAVEAAVLTTTEPEGVQAEPLSVKINDVAAPVGTVSANTPGLTIRLGVGADTTNGGHLGVGAYLVSFQIAVPAGLPSNASASAALAFTRDTTPGSAASNSVPLVAPDLVLSLPPDSGEDRVLPLGTGQTGFYDAELTNPGADAAASTLTITVPTGLVVDTSNNPVTRDDHWQTDDGSDAVSLACEPPSGGQVTCVLGAVPHGVDALVEVPLLATPAGIPGTQVNFSLNVAADAGTDQNPDDNTLDATLRFTGIAVLVYTLTPSASKTTIGDTVSVTTSVRNDGPQPADETVALAITDSAEDFKIVSFSGNTTPPQPLALAARESQLNGTGFNRQPAAAATATATRAITTANPAGTGVVWFIGTIPAHTTVTATLQLRALAVGKAQLAFLGGSDAGNPACDDPTSDAQCRQFTQITLTAVSAAPSSTPPTTTTTTPTPTPTPTPSPTLPTLANTGAPVGGLLLTAFLALALGTSLTVAGSRRRPRHR